MTTPPEELISRGPAQHRRSPNECAQAASSLSTALRSAGSAARVRPGAPSCSRSSHGDGPRAATRGSASAPCGRGWCCPGRARARRRQDEDRPALRRGHALADVPERAPLPLATSHPGDRLRSEPSTRSTRSDSSMGRSSRRTSSCPDDPVTGRALPGRRPMRGSDPESRPEEVERLETLARYLSPEQAGVLAGPIDLAPTCTRSASSCSGA